MHGEKVWDARANLKTTRLLFTARRSSAHQNASKHWELSCKAIGLEFSEVVDLMKSLVYNLPKVGIELVVGRRSTHVSIPALYMYSIS